VYFEKVHEAYHIEKNPNYLLKRDKIWKKFI